MIRRALIFLLISAAAFGQIKVRTSTISRIDVSSKQSKSDTTDYDATKSYVQSLLATKRDTGHTHTGVYEPADADIQSHLSSTSNPHSVTSTQVLPSQTGNNGKYLQTNGSSATWQTVTLTETGDIESVTVTTGLTGGGSSGAVTISPDTTNKLGTKYDLSLKSNTSHNHTGTYEPANANIQSHISNTSNPHSVTSTQVLPSQTGNNGKFLYTNGSAASWQSTSFVEVGDIESVTVTAGLTGGGSSGAVTISPDTTNKLGTKYDLSLKSNTSHNHTGTYEPANANIQSHISNTSNPHSVTSTQVLPSQTGNNGKFLQTNGSAASWATALTAETGDIESVTVTTGLTGGGSSGAVTISPDTTNKLGTKYDLSLKSNTSHNHTGTYEPANANIQSHISNTSNPHSVTSTQVLPSQTGNNGKFLQTNGSAASWATALTAETGDIESVTVTAGLTGGGSSGAVTISPDTTKLATQHDLTFKSDTSHTHVAGDLPETTTYLGSAIGGDEISITSQAVGDVLYYNGSAWVRLAKSGTNDYVLACNTSTNAPYWKVDAGGNVTLDVQIADDATYDMPSGICGTFLVHGGNANAYGLIAIDIAGQATVIAGSNVVGNIDSDTKLCFLDNGSNVRIKNRLGSTYYVKVLGIGTTNY